MIAKLVCLAVACAWCAGAQKLDFSSLDKLKTKAKSVNKVSLDGPQLADALSLLSGSDKESKKDLEELKSLVHKLTGIEVRNYEFEKKGQYKDSDLEGIRSQMEKLNGWSKIIDSKEDGEHSEIFMSSAEGNKGLVILSAEETEISVVMLKGANSLKELGSLGGIMGLPSMAVGPSKKDK